MKNALVILFMMLASAVYGADGVWINNTGDMKWATASNWSSGSIAEGKGSLATFSQSGTATITNNYVGLTNGHISVSVGTYTITSGTITMDSVSGTSTINNATALTIDSILAGANVLEKQDSGTLTLGNTNNTYSGGTIIKDGTLTITSHTHLGDVAGTLTLDGGTLSADVGSVEIASRDVMVTTNGGTITMNKDNHFRTTGKLSGSGTFKTAGGGNFGGRPFSFLSTSNDFTGEFQMTGRGYIVNVSSFADSTNPISFNHANDGASFTLDTGATAPLIFNNRWFRLINIRDDRQLSIQNDSATVTNTFTINTDLEVLETADTTFELGGSNTGTNLFAGVIPDGPATISFSKNGTGTWALSGENTFTGTTTVNGGTLILASSTCLSDTNRLTITGTGENKLQLNAGVKEKVGFLTLDTTPMASGEYGSSSSGAAIKDDTYFAGTGRLYVGIDPPPLGTVIILR